MSEYRISFKVAGEPIPTPRPRTVTKGGKTWTYSGNKPYKDWLKAIKKACPEKHNFDEARVKVYFMPHDEKTKDVDNLAKGVLDALTGVLWDNDKVVWDLHLIRFDPDEPLEPYTQIEVIGNEPEHVQTKLPPVPDGWTEKPLGKLLSEKID